MSSLNRASRSFAFSRISASRFRQTGRASAASMCSPGWSFAPSSMLSITVIADSAFVSWKVRTMPVRATRNALVAPRLSPLNRQLA